MSETELVKLLVRGSALQVIRAELLLDSRRPHTSDLSQTGHAEVSVSANQRDPHKSIEESSHPENSSSQLERQQAVHHKDSMTMT